MIAMLSLTFVAGFCIGAAVGIVTKVQRIRQYVERCKAEAIVFRAASKSDFLNTRSGFLQFVQDLAECLGYVETIDPHELQAILLKLRADISQLAQEEKDRIARLRAST